MRNSRVCVAAVTLFFLGSAAVPVLAAKAAWTLTGSMTTARCRHTATLLGNGEVLVAGGDTVPFGISTASAELYNPSNGHWTPTGSMATARTGLTATLLANGEVLAAGGHNTDVNGNVVSVAAAAEIYNPSTGQWIPTGSMTTARSGHTATLLPNGQVLVAGGTDITGAALASAELYNPSTGAWSATASLNSARSSAAATLLADGQVLIAGGGNSTSLTSAEIYNPSTDTWSLTGSMNAARSYIVMTLLNNGDALVFGSESSPSSASEFYTPATGQWTLTGSFGSSLTIVPISGSELTLLGNGEAITSGGEAPKYGETHGVFLYNPSNNSWSGTAPMNQYRAFHTATLPPNGHVLAAGGLGGSQAFSAPTIASAELYTP